MNSKHFFRLSIASLIIGIVACFFSLIFNEGGGTIWLAAGISSFVFLQFCSAILENLEKLPGRLKSAEQTISSSDSELIPELNHEARKQAVDKIKTSGFIAAEKVRTKGREFRY